MYTDIVVSCQLCCYLMFGFLSYVDTEQVVCVYRYSGILSTVLLLDVWFSFLCRH